MPRRSRMYVSGVPYHVVQRGNNREVCFFTPDDYRYYLNLLENAVGRYKVSLHAYVLMTNHVHFLMTPTDVDGISSAMKVVGSCYAQYMNKTYRRSGTLWEGRHKSSAVDAENYLLKCYRYIELNPVAASMVSCPEEYLWSSYGVNAFGDSTVLISPHDVYLSLGTKRSERCYAYRELFAQSLSEMDLNDIRKAAHYSQPLGNGRFSSQIAEKTGQKLGQMKRGRPRKEVVED